MIEGLEQWRDRRNAEQIATLKSCSVTSVEEILSHRIRTEKIAVKDIKLRTFIAEGTERDDLAAHVYDVTYGTISHGEDTIVVIDDSIVRGTTLRKSIISILSRLKPKKIVIVSSSPQVRYPDCYGIDMSQMSEFVAFNAAVELLYETGRGEIIDSVYKKCKQQEHFVDSKMENYVKDIYTHFSNREISRMIARMVTPKDCSCEVEVIYQTIDNLHCACPDHLGDWYFSGNYPTPGGNRMVNNAYISYYESLDTKKPTR